MDQLDLFLIVHMHQLFLVHWAIKNLIYFDDWLLRMINPSNRRVPLTSSE
ncbi:unnamed protein product [Schistosoma mattheei]|uniref:Uncharacterized protein n=1 Tax=Schistosoma mattheei TaxID=31246 RepID=A0A183P2D7_9TREM|nr:unnamed protein product [Schistosoma mattheei]